MIKNWANIVKEINMLGMSKHIVENCSLVSLDENHGTITLEILHKHEGLLTNSLLERIRKALSRFFGKEIDLTIKVTDGDSIYRSIHDFKFDPFDLQ